MDTLGLSAWGRAAKEYDSANARLKKLMEQGEQEATELNRENDRLWKRYEKMRKNLEEVGGIAAMKAYEEARDEYEIFADKKLGAKQDEE